MRNWNFRGVIAVVVAPFAIALDGLRGQGTRAAIAMGGVAVGVAPVVLVVTVMSGMRTALARDFGQVTPNSFSVSRTSLAEALTDTITGRHAITESEVERLAELPLVRSATASVDASVALDVGRDRFREVEVEGTAGNWLATHDGEFIAGRNFAPDEERRGAQVVVLSSALARHIAPTGDIIGETVHLEGLPFRVVGIFRERPSLTTDTTASWMRTPFTTALHTLPVNSDWMELRIVPDAGVTRQDAEDAVTARLRAARHLRPDQRDDFAIVDEEGMDALFSQYGGTLVVVMFVLTGLALVVAGVGIVGIMTISISERTVEIGVKRALGAKRRDIAAQFLLETIAITMAGGGIGISLGVAATVLLRTFTSIPAQLPPWAIVTTMLTAAVCGVGLGLYPALKAARLDPVEALRRA